MKLNKQNIKNITYVSLLILILLISYIFKGNLKTIINILSRGSVEQITALIRSWGLAAPLLSILLMLLHAVVFPIPSFLITGANGAVFGIFWGTIISWIGAMIGGTASFYLARLLGDVFVKKVIHSEDLWGKVDEISNKHGFKVIFVGRLLPFISFDFLSYAAGLSTMRLIPFLISTGIGIIPGTIAYVVLGNQITKIGSYSKSVTIIIVVAILVIAIIYFIKKRMKKRGVKK